jgi:hypothetical protein
MNCWGGSKTCLNNVQCNNITALSEAEDVELAEFFNNQLTKPKARPVVAAAAVVVTASASTTSASTAADTAEAEAQPATAPAAAVAPAAVAPAAVALAVLLAPPAVILVAAPAATTTAVAPPPAAAATVAVAVTLATILPLKTGSVAVLQPTAASCIDNYNNCPCSRGGRHTAVSSSSRSSICYCCCGR